MRKAERAAARKEKVCSRMDDMELGVDSNGSAAEKGRDLKNSTGAAQDRRTREGRRPIKAHVRHEVWLRDGGQCTHVFTNGDRCGEKSMVELDHKTMIWRGGDDTVDNLALKCRYHNQAAAEVALGSSFVA